MSGVPTPRVLIVGARGTLGQELARAFGGAEVVTWDREDVDVTDAASVQRVAAVRPDICINATAYNAMDAAEDDPVPAFALNERAVGLLADIAASCGATFVHYSTDCVFGGSGDGTYAEDAAPDPLSAYGRSKAAGEHALLAVAAAHPGWRWHLIRTSRLFGAPGSSMLSKRSFVDTMRDLSATRDRIEVVAGEVSSPTYAPDLAAATAALVRSGAPSGIYHRTNDGACAWEAFAREIFRLIGWRGTLVPVPSDALPRPARRPASSILVSTKLPPMRPWQAALAEYLARAAHDGPRVGSNPAQRSRSDQSPSTVSR